MNSVSSTHVGGPQPTSPICQPQRSFSLFGKFNSNAGTTLARLPSPPPPVATSITGSIIVLDNSKVNFMIHQGSVRMTRTFPDGEQNPPEHPNTREIKAPATKRSKKESWQRTSDSLSFVLVSKPTRTGRTPKLTTKANIEAVAKEKSRRLKEKKARKGPKLRSIKKKQRSCVTCMDGFQFLEIWIPIQMTNQAPLPIAMSRTYLVEIALMIFSLQYYRKLTLMSEELQKEIH